MVTGMQLQQIESFIAVADAANFTHAARKTHTSQPTLSRHISLLEAELSFELFQRGKRPLRLTESGRVLYEGMKKALGQMDYAVEMARAASQGRSGTLSVGFLENVYAEHLYLPVIEGLKGTCSTLDLRCTKMNTEELIKGLMDESLDVAVSIEFDLFGEADLRVTRLEGVPCFLVVSSQHRLAAKNVLDRGDLDGETLFLNAPMEAYRIDVWMHRLFDLKGTRRVEVPTTEAAYLNVLCEGGLAISNAYDPIVHGSDLYHCIPIPMQDRLPHFCAVDNPLKRNAVKDLFLELLKHAEAIA